MDEGKIRGLAECLKRQQETGSRKAGKREGDERLFISI